MKQLAALWFVITTAGSLIAQLVVSESKFVDIAHLKVHYTNYGKGETALVFVHGWACDETVWSDQAPALAEKIRTVTIDLPGHGQSDKPQTISYDKELYARAIDAGSGQTTSVVRRLRVVRAQAHSESGLSGLGERFAFPDDGEAARVQRRSGDFFAAEPAPAKSLVSSRRIG